MAIIIDHTKGAEVVLNYLKGLAGDDPTHRIEVHSISTGKQSGYHLYNQILDRHCNILPHDVTDGFIFNYGVMEDYRYPDRLAKPFSNVVRRDFAVDEAYSLAVLALNWLTGKGVDYQGDY